MEGLEKLVIAAANLLVCYSIVEVSYTRALLITKLVFIDIEFEVSRKTNCTYGVPAKFGRETRPS